MAINTKLLRKTMDFIDAHPEKWEQGNWTSACGTSHCFAGWAVALTANQIKFGPGFEYLVPVKADGSMVSAARSDLVDPYEVGDPSIHVSTRATRLLGLSREQANELFAGYNSLPHLHDLVDGLIAQAVA